MLTVVRSPFPCISHAPDPPPESISLLGKLKDDPCRCLWVVPTGRRRRAILRELAAGVGGSASYLPEVVTLEGLVTRALGFVGVPDRPLADAERLLRVARAWLKTYGRPAGAGLVHQLDGFIRDWQALGLQLPVRPRDGVEKTIRCYLSDLQRDRRLDRMGAVALLAREFTEAEGRSLRSFRQRYPHVLFDGFHRLEPIELDLIAASSVYSDILLWVVGVAGRREWATLDAAVEHLRRRGTPLRLVDHYRDPPTPLAALGRRLFDSVPHAAATPSPEVFTLKAANAFAEVEEVARRIKTDHQSFHGNGRTLHLSDVAVIIPGPAYDALIRQEFTRAGLRFNLAGRVLRVSGSRPGRLVLAALEVIRSRWACEALLDFLSVPAVRARLCGGHRLRELLGHLPRQRHPLSYRLWTESWERAAGDAADRLDRWRSGEAELPRGVNFDRDEFLDGQADAARGLRQLIDSVRPVLAPVDELDAALAAPRDDPTLQSSVDVLAKLLATLRIDEWLVPGSAGQASTDAGGPPVPGPEWEKDQQAYGKLVGLFDSLRPVAPDRLPLRPANADDVLRTWRLVLDAETYQVRAEDDAGIQVLESREIRGLRFRHVYVLGLVDGQVPVRTPDGVLAGARRGAAALRRQGEEREAESEYLFRQIFEAARERVVLAWPCRDDQGRTLPSPFVGAVEAQACLPDLPRADAVVTIAEAARHLGRAESPNGGRPWAAKELEAAGLVGLVQRLEQWRKRRESGLPHQVVIHAPGILRLLFPDDRPFTPSALETYAACPFRYFAMEVLGLEEREPNRTRRAYGTLVHRALRRFYEHRRRTFRGTADMPLPATDVSDLADLRRFFEEEWAAADDGTLPAELLRLFVHEAGIQGLVREFVQQIEADHGNLFNEFPLRGPDGRPVFIGNDPDGRPVYVTGTIDRVDVDRTRGEALIVDYKTGRCVPPGELARKMKQGRSLQLALYAAAWRQVQPRWPAVRAAYVHLHEDVLPGRSAIRRLGDWGGGDGRVPPLPTEEATAQALELAGAARAGRFPLTTYGAGTHGECTAYCPTRHACRHPDGHSA